MERARVIAQTRLNDKFGAFLGNSRNGAEFNSRWQLVADEVKATVDEVAAEHGVDGDELVLVASVLAKGHDSGCDCAFCKNKGNLPGSKKDDSDSDDKDDDDSKDDDKDDKDSGKPWEKDSSVQFPTSSVYVRGTEQDFDWDGVIEKTAAGVCAECHHPMDKHSAAGNSEDGEKGCTLCDCSRGLVKDETAGAGLKAGSVEVLAMAVTKKDFNAIAQILQTNGADPGLAQQIADYFATQNPNFDNQRFMDASQPVQQAQPEQAQTFAAVSAAIKLAAEGAPDKDTFWQDQIDLHSTDSKDGVSEVGSPKIDKGPSGDNDGWTIPKIDVPSELHPTEEQNILKPTEFDAELPGPSNTGTRIDADTPLQPEFTTADGTDTWSGTEGQASPVTSAVLSKWQPVDLSE